MTTNTPEPEVRACGCRTEAKMSDGETQGKLLAHGFREGETVTTPEGREWQVVTVQNDVAMVTNGWMTTWYGVEELTRQQHSGRGPATGGDE